MTGTATMNIRYTQIKEAYLKVSSLICKEVNAYLFIFMLAFLLRSIYLWEIHNYPAFQLLMGDARYFDFYAIQIVKGDWLIEQMTLQPFYPYFLAIIYKIFGRDLIAVRIIQILLGACSCLFIAGAGRYFFSKKVGIISGFVLAVYPTAIFFDGLIGKSVFDLFFITLLLLFLGKITFHENNIVWFLCGVSLGCFGLVRENGLVLIPPVLVWGVIYFKGVSIKKRLLWGTLFLIGTGIVFTPVAIRNKTISGDYSIGGAHFGSNLYMGNNINAKGVYMPLRSGRGNVLYEIQDITRMAEEATGRQLTPSEVSHYWTQKTLSYIQLNPGHWLRLMAKKWLLVWNAAEVGDSEDQYGYSEWSFLLKSLGWFFYFGTLCPLAVFGICLTWRERNKLLLLYLMLFCYAASVVLFFVFARYRFPMISILILFAAAGLRYGHTFFRQGKYKVVLISLFITLIAAIMINWRMVSKDYYNAYTHSNIGIRLAEVGNTHLAAKYFLKSIDLNPANVAGYNGFGKIMLQIGKTDEAISYFQKALKVSPDSEESRDNLDKALTLAAQKKMQ